MTFVDAFDVKEVEAAFGAVMLISAIVFLPARFELRAFAVTLGVWSLLELGIGVGLFLKTGAQVATREANEPSVMVTTELPRMERVQRTFVIIEAVWMVFIVAGAVIGWRMKEQVTVSGIALACVINASIFLFFDIVAERRGATYLAQLR